MVPGRALPSADGCKPPSRHLEAARAILDRGLLAVTLVLLVGLHGAEVHAALESVTTIMLALLAAVGGTTSLSAARHIPEYLQRPSPAAAPAAPVYPGAR